MLKFCRNTQKDIYIYGYSKKGKLMYQYLSANDIDVKGFIISDGQEKKAKCPANQFFLSEIDGANTAILMGISYCWYNAVFPEIVKKGITDIYFLTETKNYSELQKYDNWFFEEHEKKDELYLSVDFSYKMSKKIISYLINNGVKIRSSIDFGGGSGAWSKAIKDVAGADILVLDGNNIDRSKLLMSNEFLQCDFAKDDIIEKIGKKEKFDIALCIEVAEHIDEELAEGFIKNICSTSDVILFSAAIRYQGGNHHVNEQMQSYWCAIFKKNNYRIVDCIRKRFWNDEEIDCVIRQNCFLYVSEEKYDEYVDLLGNDDMPLNIVHPELYINKLYSHEEGWLM